MLLCKFCNKSCKNDNSLRNHERLCKQNPSRQESTLAMNRQTVKSRTCEFCHKSFLGSAFNLHKNCCKQDPNNQKICPVCKKLYSKKGVTCSHGCANIYFRSGENNPNWREDSYRSTCFLYHKKECVVCKESKIVEVHHLDEDRENNKPENLIPLCPTHHQYFHSRFRDEVIQQIEEYIYNFMYNQ